MTEQANPTQGADLHAAADRIGNILDPKPQEEAPKQEVTQEAAPPAAPETVEQETQEQQDAGSESQEAATQESEERQFSSLQELAEALEMPLDDFLGKIKGKVKINGVEQDVTLADMRNGYQMEADYRRKTAELAEQRKAFESERERIASEIGTRFTEAQQITGFLEQQLMGEYNSIDWNQLRVSDPAEFAARKAEYNDRFSQIQALKANVVHQLQAQQAELEQKNVHALQSMLAEEQQKLFSAIPEFADEAKAKEIKGQMRDFLKGLGYNDQEIGNIYDHRHVMILRDAMAYRALKSKGAEVKNKVVNAPKLQKPGPKPDAGVTADRNIRERMAKLKKSGRVEDAAALIKL